MKSPASEPAKEVARLAHKLTSTLSAIAMTGRYVRARLPANDPLIREAVDEIIDVAEAAVKDTWAIEVSALAMAKNGNDGPS